jgi:hypothetical protein
MVFFAFFCNNCPAQEDPYDMRWADTPPVATKNIKPQKKDIDKDFDKDSEKDTELEEEHPRSPRGFINTGFVFFPLYSDEDGQSAFGLDLMYYFRRQTESPMSAPCYLRTYFSAGKDQYATFGASFNNYWDSEQYNLFVSFDYGRRLAGFFEPYVYSPSLLGVYRASDAELDLMFRTKVTDFSYIGARYEFIYNVMESKVPPGAFSNGQVIGLNGGPVSGIGIVWNNEPVSDLFSPKTDFVFDVTNMFYASWFGSDFDFGKHLVDLKEYYRIYGLHTIVFQYYALLHSGDVPYRQLSRVGDVFDAYSRDKYTGRHMMAMKGEYRMPLFPRTFLTGFIGLAYITNSFSKFRLNSNLPSYGGGLRFLLNTDLNINARLDIVSGRDGTGVWLGVGEGF